MTTLEMKKAVLPLRLDQKAGKPAVTGRSFSGLASTPELDLGGDIVEPTAFATWLAEWKADSHLVPLLDTHDTSSIHRILGKLVDAEIRATGLWTKWELVDSPSGAEVLARVKGGFVTGLSIGYRVRDAETLRDSIRRILDIDLKEVSLVAFPMNLGSRVETRGLLLPTDPKRLEAERELALSMKRMGFAPDDPRRRALERQVERMRRRTDPVYNL